MPHAATSETEPEPTLAHSSTTSASVGKDHEEIVPHAVTSEAEPEPTLAHSSTTSASLGKDHVEIVPHVVTSEAVPEPTLAHPSTTSASLGKDHEEIVDMPSNPHPVSRAPASNEASKDSSEVSLIYPTLYYICTCTDSVYMFNKFIIS